MSDPFELWRGITVSDSLEDVRRKFPSATGDTGLDLGYFGIAGYQFLARWYHWRGVDPKVKLQLADHCDDIRGLSKSVRQLMSLKFGRGKAMAKYNDIERKIWDGRFVRAQMTFIQDRHFPTIYIEYFRPLHLSENWWAEDVMPSLENI